jgi:hypothetical protein
MDKLCRKFSFTSPPKFISNSKMFKLIWINFLVITLGDKWFYFILFIYSLFSKIFI